MAGFIRVRHGESKVNLDRHLFNHRSPLRWQGELVYISEALAGELPGIAEVECDRWLVRFAEVEPGTIDRTTPRMLRRSSPSTDRKPSPRYPVQTVTYESGCTRERRGRCRLS